MIRRMVLLLGILFWAAPGRADRVVLDNGDALTGDNCSISSGTVSMQTGYSDAIALDLARVRLIEFSNPVEVEFADGVKIETKLLDAAAEDLARISCANLPPVDPLGINLAFGYGVSDGNTNKANLLAALDVFYLFPAAARLDFSGRYEYGNEKKEGEARAESANNGSAQIKADLFVIGGGYCYVLSKYGFDRMKDIDRRLENGLGVGYDVLNEEEGYLGLEFGGTYIDTRYDDAGESKEHGIYLRLADNAQYRINSVVTISEELSYQPQADDFSIYLIDASATVSFNLSSSFYLGLILIDRYESDPVAGKKPNDLSLYASLGFSL